MERDSIFSQWIQQPIPSPRPPPLTCWPWSDTGISDSDNITRQNNADVGGTLTLTVDGLVNGAQVQLFSGDTIIGTATAFGTSATVITNGTAVLADGVQTVQATQNGKW